MTVETQHSIASAYQWHFKCTAVKLLGVVVFSKVTMTRIVLFMEGQLRVGKIQQLTVRSLNTFGRYKGMWDTE